MSASSELHFDAAGLGKTIEALDDSRFDALEYGVIGFDADYVVRRYNATESHLAGLARESVLEQPLFTVVAQCMNNFMVAQRFEDAAASGAALDTTLDYVLTLRMKPIKVKLRLIAEPGAGLRYVLVNRRT